MYQYGRPVLANFDRTEFLYLRFGREDFVQGQLAPAAVRFPKTSVNRGSLSEPEDALFDEGGKYDGLGVVEFAVSDIPEKVEQQQGPAYVFFMSHVPFEDNYAHSEIWSDQLPATAVSLPTPTLPAPHSEISRDQLATTRNYREPSKTVKLEFRIRLCKRITQERVRIEAVRNRSTNP